MGIEDTDKKKKKAMVLVNNEIVINAVKEVLDAEGFETRQGIESCEEADIGFIGSYFMIPGILRHLRSVNCSLPLVLIENSKNGLSEDLDYDKEFYDVVQIDKYDEKEVHRKLTQWFSEGQGKFLAKGK